VANRKTLQDATRISRPESFLSTFVKPVRIDAGEITASAQGTGFFWERESRWFLITNIHVLTGWNHEIQKSLSDSAFFPTHLGFQLAVDVGRDEAEGNTVQRRGFQVPLDNDGGPVWLEHPVHGSNVDVAAVEVCKAPDEGSLQELGVRQILTIPVNRHDEWISFDLAAGEDAYVLGYPKGMATRGFPIWKRASIASEPEIDIDDLPKLLVDTATREGMSGAPVIGVRRGLTMPSGSFDNESIIGETMKFLGVYSGRIGEDELGVQLGIVWKASVIDEIIDGATRGRWPWDVKTS
jgi:hypothetical protein